jgi:thiamine phosphate synthase YjbQ (UPF0047 family)
MHTGVHKKKNMMSELIDNESDHLHVVTTGERWAVVISDDKIALGTVSTLKD